MRIVRSDIEGTHFDGGVGDDGLVVEEGSDVKSWLILITEDGGLAGCEGQDQAHAVAVFRYMGQTEMAQFAWIAPQAPSRHGLTVQYHAAIGYRPDAGDGLQQFALPISGYTGNADDLAGAY